VWIDLRRRSAVRWKKTPPFPNGYTSAKKYFLSRNAPLHFRAQPFFFQTRAFASFFLPDMSLEKIIKVTGRAVSVPGDDIDTDRIIPARFLKCITFDGLGEFAFHDERHFPDGTPKPHPLNDPIHNGATVLVSGFNFGCGSSREHAPQSLRRAGFRAVIAGSFAEIFFGNSTAIGLPCLTAAKEDLAALAAWADANPTTEISVDVAAQTVSFGTSTIPVSIPANQHEALINGRWDAIADLLEGGDAVENFAAKLPEVKK
jgi:3-isopropylmalate/(R)-2-methylmalate dehydratase small subunit